MWPGTPRLGSPRQPFYRASDYTFSYMVYQEKYDVTCRIGKLLEIVRWG